MSETTTGQCLNKTRDLQLFVEVESEQHVFLAFLLRHFLLAVAAVLDERPGETRDVARLLPLQSTKSPRSTNTPRHKSSFLFWLVFRFRHCHVATTRVLNIEIAISTSARQTPMTAGKEHGSKTNWQALNLHK